jgi:hypothetical protein
MMLKTLIVDVDDEAMAKRVSCVVVGWRSAM